VDEDTPYASGDLLCAIRCLDGNEVRLRRGGLRRPAPSLRTRTRSVLPASSQSWEAAGLDLSTTIEGPRRCTSSLSNAPGSRRPPAPTRCVLFRFLQREHLIVAVAARLNSSRSVAGCAITRSDVRSPSCAPQLPVVLPGRSWSFDAFFRAATFPWPPAPSFLRFAFAPGSTAPPAFIRRLLLLEMVSARLLARAISSLRQPPAAG